MIKNLSLSQKLAISNLLYAVPVIVLISMLFGARNADIRFAELEIVGDNFEKPLNSLLEHVSRHKIVLQRALSGDTSARASLQGLESQVDSDLSTLRDADASMGTELLFTDEALAKRKEENFRYKKVASQWDEIKSKTGTFKPAESNDAHTAMILNIRGMITHLGNASNLILDPELDSYYLSDATLGGLPQIEDRIQEITTFSEPVLRRGAPSAEEKSQFAVYAALLQGDLDRITSDIQTALQEDPNFHGKSETLQKNLPPITSDLSNSVGALVSQLKDLTGGKNVALAAFLDTSEKALSTSFKHWDVSMPENNILLEKRISDIKVQRATYVIVGFLVLLFASVIAFIIGRGLNQTVTSAIQQLAQSADRARTSSIELAEYSQRLSSSATEQAAAIQETVATLNEINAMVDKSLENAKQSAQTANDSQATAVQGKKSVEQMIHAIGEINTSNENIRAQIESSNAQFRGIVEIITEISDKTKVINDIVFQTKLLSFNASVEAARAGEQGKGFAVVAEEVGNLASMSGNAAQEISSMLVNSVQKVESIIQETTQSIGELVAQGKEKVETGIGVANQCNDTLEKIVNSVSGVNNMVAEISMAAQEQVRGVNEITKAMDQLDQTTSSNTSMAQKTAQSAEQVQLESRSLRNIVVDMEKNILGKEIEKSHSDVTAQMPVEATT